MTPGLAAPAKEGATAPRWRAACAEKMLLREWGDECVVRLDADASTHLLDRSASAILGTLLNAPRALSIVELAEQAFGATGASISASLSADEHAALNAVLLELQRIGVAQPEQS